MREVFRERNEPMHVKDLARACYKRAGWSPDKGTTPELHMQTIVEKEKGRKEFRYIRSPVCVVYPINRIAEVQTAYLNKEETKVLPLRTDIVLKRTADVILRFKDTGLHGRSRITAAEHQSIGTHAEGHIAAYFAEKYPTLFVPPPNQDQYEQWGPWDFAMNLPQPFGLMTFDPKASKQRSFYGGADINTPAQYVLPATYLKHSVWLFGWQHTHIAKADRWPTTRVEPIAGLEFKFKAALSPESWGLYRMCVEHFGEGR